MIPKDKIVKGLTVYHAQVGFHDTGIVVNVGTVKGVAKVWITMDNGDRYQHDGFEARFSESAEEALARLGSVLVRKMEGQRRMLVENEQLVERLNVALRTPGNWQRGLVLKNTIYVEPRK